jgi:TetR/AcrR family acrAB operon transcriptional repressor
LARRTKDEALETRNVILDTAERVFSEHGVSRTSLADIAAAAGVTRGAIYWHFQDKADLFCKMVARVTLPMEDAPCQVDHGAAADPLASIRSMMVSILRRTREDPQARRVFHIVFHKCEYVDEMRPVWKRLIEMQAGCLAGIEKGLHAAVARRLLPRGLDAARAALGLHALLDGLISKSVMDPECIALAHEPEHLVDFFLDGLRQTVSPRRGITRTDSSRTRRPPRLRHSIRAVSARPSGKVRRRRT